MRAPAQMACVLAVVAVVKVKAGFIAIDRVPYAAQTDREIKKRSLARVPTKCQLLGPPFRGFWKAGALKMLGFFTPVGSAPSLLRQPQVVSAQNSGSANFATTISRPLFWAARRHYKLERASFMRHPCAMERGPGRSRSSSSRRSARVPVAPPF